MTELSFAKTFLSLLEKQGPPKLQPDYVSDPKTFVPKGPYTLPRNPTPMKFPSANAASNDPSQDISTQSSTGAASSDKISISLKSARNPQLDVKLPKQELSTSVLDLKTAVQKEIGGEGVELSSVKIIYKKKPCADIRTIKEVLGDEVTTLAGKEVEFGVMVMGYKPKPAATTAEESLRDNMDGVEATAPVAQGSSGEEELEKEEFWNDLKGFLSQRLRDEGTAGDVFDVFREGWRRKGVP